MQRLEFVDSLRGLAAHCIVAFHMALVPDPNLAMPHWAQTIVLNGQTAVTLFFVVSAFSLCQSMKAHDGQPNEVRDFYIRRLFRIGPLFYVMLVSYGFRDALGFGMWHGIWEWAKNVLFVFNFFPGSEQGIVWASWTIGAEMAFYTIFPLLFARFRNVFSLVALAFAAILGAVVFHEFVLNLPISSATQGNFYQHSFFRLFPVFIIGMLSWAMYDRFLADRETNRSVGATLILGGLVAYYALLNGALNVGFPDGSYWQAIIYSALLLGFAISPAPVFVNRLSLFAGKTSYSIYLVHPSAVLFLSPVYRRIYSLDLPVSASFLLCFGVTLGIVLPASLLTYRLVEAPGMKLGKLLLARMHAAPIAAAIAPQPI